MVATTNRKALPTAIGKGLRKNNLGLQCSAHGADRKGQQRRILSALRLRPHTTYELRGDPVGSFQAPTRVKELRELGYDIRTHRVTVVDHAGFQHPRVALYELVSEPGLIEEVL